MGLPAAVRKFVCHSKKVGSLAREHGWLPAARYTNLRDTRTFGQLGFLDIEWKRYNFEAHLNAARRTLPLITVARDVEDVDSLDAILAQADKLSEFVETVVIVPKDPRLTTRMDLIPPRFVLGYSVPSKYGATSLPVSAFLARPVHLLGGRPDKQRSLADSLNVVSFDCNRFTLDAAFGDYFDGKGFKPHPVGGYERCLNDSLRNITALWNGYSYGDAWGGDL